MKGGGIAPASWIALAVVLIVVMFAGQQRLTTQTFATVTVGSSSPTTITNIRVYQSIFDPAPVPAASTAELSFTVSGLRISDNVSVSKPSHTAGCIIGGARVSADDTLAITFGNVQAALACDPPSETYTVVAIRS